jgi:hypothetical protein
VFLFIAKLAVFIEDLKLSYIHIRRKRSFIINRNGINASISVVYVFNAGFLLSGDKAVWSFPCVGSAARSGKFQSQISIPTQRSIRRNGLRKCGVANQ